MVLVFQDTPELRNIRNKIRKLLYLEDARPPSAETFNHDKDENIIKNAHKDLNPGIFKISQISLKDFRIKILEVLGNPKI